MKWFYLYLVLGISSQSCTAQSDLDKKKTGEIASVHQTYPDVNSIGNEPSDQTSQESQDMVRSELLTDYEHPSETNFAAGLTISDMNNQLTGQTNFPAGLTNPDMNNQLPQATLPLTEVLSDAHNRTVGWKINVANKSKPVVLTILVGIKSDSVPSGNMAVGSDEREGFAQLVKSLEKNSISGQEDHGTSLQAMVPSKISSFTSHEKILKSKKKFKDNFSAKDTRDMEEELSEKTKCDSTAGVTCHCVEDSIDDDQENRDAKSNLETNPKKVINTNGKLGSFNADTTITEEGTTSCVPATKPTTNCDDEHILTTIPPCVYQDERDTRKRLIGRKKSSDFEGSTTSPSVTPCYVPVTKPPKDRVTEQSEHILTTEKSENPCTPCLRNDEDDNVHVANGNEMKAKQSCVLSNNPEHLALGKGSSGNDILFDDELIKAILNEKAFNDLITARTKQLSKPCGVKKKKGEIE
ncbi:hypothetical protein M8J77_023668 [Diaphorina citri]|nr:hypothetical protein M8J77_023668 [Diaphorina citri]